MRVVLATRARQPGGVWRHVVDLAHGLSRRGVDARVALPAPARSLQARAEAEGLPWCTLAAGLTARADVWHLHLHDTYDLWALPALAARRATAATVATEHLPRTNASDSSLLPGPRTRGAARARTAWKLACCRLTDRTIAVSEGSRRFMLERYGWRPDRVVTIPNGVGEVPPAPWPGAGEARFLSLGSLIAQKGHDVLVRAAGEASVPWRATVLGEGPARERLEALVSEVGDGRVALSGWSDDVDGEIAASAALCMPSRWEALPYAALEAMARGRPVVGTRVDGLEEIVEDGVTGALVPPDDPRALAEVLDALSARPQALAEMGRTARERVSARFGLDAMVDRTLEVYREASARG